MLEACGKDSLTLSKAIFSIERQIEQLPKI